MTAAELDALAEVMIRRKIVLLKDGALHVELYGPSLVAPVTFAAPAVPPKPAEESPDSLAPWAAFRPQVGQAGQQADTRISGAMAQNGEPPGDDSALFATDLPQH